ncbi:MAG: proline--tRNA ligase, partial [Candidatus Bathyarchaeia archaeon]
KGHLPTLFPALIPESNFRLESEHVKGFLPEVFWVTEAGAKSERLEERLALRPTSETAMYKMYSLWIRSWRDLPLKLYQRCQVWRYETKATRPFIRSREFYWIETHNAFASLDEALSQVKEDMETTQRVLHDFFCVPFLFFTRPDHDKFAGAIHTYAADTLMPDGRALQLPSTHLLGQNFSKPFEIKYVDKYGVEQYVWQTCYGPAISRIFAAVVAIHGDDKGLVIPPKIAPIQSIIVPIFSESMEKSRILAMCENVRGLLNSADVRVKIDDREEYTPGWKFNHWELRGVPLRIEVGPKDVENEQVVLVRRDTGQHLVVPMSDLASSVWEVLEKVQVSLMEKADKFFKSNIHEASSFDELKRILEHEGGFVRVNWCGREVCAEEIKEETNGGTIRGTLYGKVEEPVGSCVHCADKATQVVYVSKQY